MTVPENTLSLAIASGATPSSCRAMVPPPTGAALRETASPVLAGVGAGGTVQKAAAPPPPPCLARARGGGQGGERGAAPPRRLPGLRERGGAGGVGRRPAGEVEPVAVGEVGGVAPVLGGRARAGPLDPDGGAGALALAAARAVVHVPVD